LKEKNGEELSAQKLKVKKLKDKAKMNSKYLFHEQSSIVKREPLNVNREPSTTYHQTSSHHHINCQPSTINNQLFFRTTNKNKLKVKS